MCLRPSVISLPDWPHPRLGPTHPSPGALQGPHLYFGLQMFQPETTKRWKPPAFWAQGWGASGTSNSLAPTWAWEHWVTPGVVTLGLGSLEGLDKRARKGLLGGRGRQEGNCRILSTPSMLGPSVLSSYYNPLGWVLLIPDLKP